MNTRLLVGTSNCSNVKPEFYFLDFRRPSVTEFDFRNRLLLGVHRNMVSYFLQDPVELYFLLTHMFLTLYE